MKTKHYSNAFLIDPKRVEKLITLFNASVKNDLSKWTQKLSTRTGYNKSNTWDLIFYYSPIYGGINFVVELANDSYNGFVYGMCYINEKNPAISGQELQIFADWNMMSKIPSVLKSSIDSLRDNVFESELRKLEEALSTKNDRRDKLEQLNIEAYKSIIEDSYSDFMQNPTDAFARMIARTAYGFNKNHNLPYSEWLEKFKEYKNVIREIEKLDEKTDQSS